MASWLCVVAMVSLLEFHRVVVVTGDDPPPPYYPSSDEFLNRSEDSSDGSNLYSPITQAHTPEHRRSYPIAAPRHLTDPDDDLGTAMGASKLSWYGLASPTIVDSRHSMYKLLLTIRHNDENSSINAFTARSGTSIGDKYFLVDKCFTAQWNCVLLQSLAEIFYLFFYFRRFKSVNATHVFTLSELIREFYWKSMVLLKPLSVYLF